MTTNNLGGSVRGPIGDPATYCPNLWAWAIGTFKVKSMVDVGCGHGYSLDFFITSGVESIGIEGDREAIKNGCRSDKVIRHDYENEGPFPLPGSVDLGWCCEVLEHIEENKIDNLISTLKCAKYVMVTHAVPGQGGFHHVNEQLPDYWIDKFTINNFSLLSSMTDCARRITEVDSYFYNGAQPNYFTKTGLVFYNLSLKGE